MGVPKSNNLSEVSQAKCIAKKIINILDEPFIDEDWEIEVFEDPVINASVLPGGKIAINTGLIDITENQDQLAAVIAHEIAHTIENHVFDRQKKAMRTKIGTAIGAGVIAGNIANRTITSQSDIYTMNNQINALNTMGSVLSEYGLQLPYERKQETEADIIGIKLMAKAGFNPFASISIWKNMPKDNVPEFAKSHPSPENRIKGLSSQLSESLELYNAVERKPRCTF